MQSAERKVISYELKVALKNKLNSLQKVDAYYTSLRREGDRRLRRWRVLDTNTWSVGEPSGSKEKYFCFGKMNIEK